MSYLFMVVVLKVKPYLPHEWTPKGMLERVNAFSEYYVSAVSSNSLLSIRACFLFFISLSAVQIHGLSYIQLFLFVCSLFICLFLSDASRLVA